MSASALSAPPAMASSRGCAQPALDMLWRYVGRHTLIERLEPLPMGTPCAICGATDLPVWPSVTFGTMCAALRSVAAKHPSLRDRREDGSYPVRGGTAIADGAAARASAVRPALVANVPLRAPCDVDFRPAWTPGPALMSPADRLVAETLLDPPAPPFVLVQFGQKMPRLRITEDANLVLLNEPGDVVTLSRRRLLDALALVRRTGMAPDELRTLQRWIPAWRLSEATPQQMKFATTLRDRVGTADWHDLVQLVPGVDDLQARWLHRLLALTIQG